MDMTRDIHKFIKSFEDKYGQSIEITIGVDESRIRRNKHTLKGIETIALLFMYQRSPELYHIKNFSYKSRKLIFVMYSQAFQYIAFNLGYKKIKIGALIARNHATVINSIRKVENYLYTASPEFIDIYYPLLNKIENYVGTLSNDGKGQSNSKSVLTTFCNTKKDISASD
jgi:hypothetical protein